MTTGEGGMFVTNDDDLYERVLTLSNHGRARGQTRQFWPETVGYKYKMSNIQAAIGCGQMARVEELICRKRQILQYYRQALLPLRGLSMNPEPLDGVNGAWMPTVIFERDLGITREHLISEFSSANIDARVFFWPLSQLPVFSGAEGKPLAKDIAARSINLPSYHDITPAQLDQVIQVIVKLHGEVCRVQ
jgi:perosamine synthetase